MEFETKFVQFNSTDNYKLSGLFNESENKDIAIIHIHGMGSSIVSSTGLSVLEGSKINNIGCLIFNNRGNNYVNRMSSTIDKKQDFWAGTSYEIFEDCIHDIQGAINFIKSKGYKKIILSGHSSGAQKVLYYANQTKEQQDIIGYIFLSAGDDLNLFKEMFIPENFNEVFKKAQDTYNEKTLFSIPQIGSLSSKRFVDLVKEDSIEGNLFNYKIELKHISKIKQPILTVFGKDEKYKVIPLEQELEIISKQYQNTKSQKAIISGDHSFRGHSKELKETIFNWIKQIN